VILYLGYKNTNMSGLLTIRKNARISAAENGLILHWNDYTPSENAYDGVTYIGEKSKVFKVTEGQECIDELIAISKEENLSQIYAASARMNDKKDNC